MRPQPPSGVTKLVAVPDFDSGFCGFDPHLRCLFLLNKKIKILVIFIMRDLDKGKINNEM